jgi:hypothetical protein
MSDATALVPIGKIEQAILLIRRQKVMLDADLASIYGVTTKALNQAIKRNIRRFPKDFLFRLTTSEKKEVVTNCDHLSHLKYSPTLPYAFTEHGAIMAASVLNSSRAVEMSILVVRAFVKLRHILSTHRQLATKLSELERKVAGHDESIQTIFEAIRQLMAEPVPKKRRIGFGVKDE